MRNRFAEMIQPESLSQEVIIRAEWDTKADSTWVVS